jgi:hypothetical protein
LRDYAFVLDGRKSTGPEVGALLIATATAMGAAVSYVPARDWQLPAMHAQGAVQARSGSGMGRRHASGGVDGGMAAADGHGGSETVLFDVAVAKISQRHPRGFCRCRLLLSDQGVRERPVSSGEGDGAAAAEEEEVVVEEEEEEDDDVGSVPRSQRAYCGLVTVVRWWLAGTSENVGCAGGGCNGAGLSLVWRDGRYLLVLSRSFTSSRLTA